MCTYIYFPTSQKKDPNRDCIDSFDELRYCWLLLYRKINRKWYNRAQPRERQPDNGSKVGHHFPSKQPRIKTSDNTGQCMFVPKLWFYFRIVASDVWHQQPVSLFAVQVSQQVPPKDATQWRLPKHLNKLTTWGFAAFNKAENIPKNHT